jgi:hypothetical protein
MKKAFGTMCRILSIGKTYHKKFQIQNTIKMLEKYLPSI